MTVFKTIYLLFAFALTVLVNVMVREEGKPFTIKETLISIVVGLAWPAIVLVAIVMTSKNK